MRSDPRNYTLFERARYYCGARQTIARSYTRALSRTLDTTVAA
jgi:hypothetical protein